MKLSLVPFLALTLPLLLINRVAPVVGAAVVHAHVAKRQAVEALPGPWHREDHAKRQAVAIVSSHEDCGCTDHHHHHHSTTYPNSPTSTPPSSGPTSSPGSGSGGSGGSGGGSGGEPSTTTATTTITVTGGADPTGTTCSTGPVQCCDSVESADSSSAATLLGLLGVVLQGVDIPIGLTCTPISVIGVGSAGTCSAQTVCCENNSFNGLIAIGCTPISVGL